MIYQSSIFNLDDIEITLRLVTKPALQTGGVGFERYGHLHTSQGE